MVVTERKDATRHRLHCHDVEDFLGLGRDDDERGERVELGHVVVGERACDRDSAQLLARQLSEQVRDVLLRPVNEGLSLELGARTCVRIELVNVPAPVRSQHSLQVLSEGPETHEDELGGGEVLEDLGESGEQLATALGVLEVAVEENDEVAWLDELEVVEEVDVVALLVVRAREVVELLREVETVEVRDLELGRVPSLRHLALRDRRLQAAQEFGLYCIQVLARLEHLLVEALRNGREFLEQSGLVDVDDVLLLRYF